MTSPTRFNSHQGHPQQRQNSCWTCGSKSHISCHCTKPTKPPKKKTPEVCRNFNKFTSAHCEQANNKCSAGRLHKCSNCNKWGCKAVCHKESTASSLVAGLQSTDSPNNEIAPGDQDIAIFGLPAVTNATGTLKERHILWTPIISAGEKLPLPPDSCCSVYLVSHSHAVLVASKCPHLSHLGNQLQFLLLIHSPTCKLLIGTIEIPIQ